MKKKIIVYSLMTLLLLTGCGGGEGNKEELKCDDGKYRVQVNKPDGNYLDTEFSVQWCSSLTGNCYPMEAKKGIATIELEDGDYSIHVLGLPDQYTYDPSAYIATAENKCVEINLTQVLEPTVNNKTDVDGETPIPPGNAYNPYIVTEGAYKANITSADEVVYFGFRPSRPGSYVIESWSDDIWVNSEGPAIAYFDNNNQYINVESPIKTDDNSGYDKNFKIQLDIAIEEFDTILNEKNEIEYVRDENGNYIPGGNYVFGISASVNRLAKKIPFVIKRIGDYVVEHVKAESVEITSTLSTYPEKLENDVFKSLPLDGTAMAYYNSEDGFYHYRRKTGPVIVALISKPNLYLADQSFTTIQEAGNKALTLDGGKKDYTAFISEYAKYCNSDGAYGVTEELKLFLELFYKSIENWFNSDSNVNRPETIVDENFGWMFACGYYVDIAESYDVPVGGNGTIEEPFEIREGCSYYVDLPANSSLYYSFYNQNRDSEKLYWIKSSEPNALFEIDGTTYSSSEGPSAIIALGGMNNPAICTLKVSTVDGSDAKFVIELLNREKTVEGDQIALGINTVEVEPLSSVDCTYVANRKGTYSFFCGEANAMIIDSNGNTYLGSNGPISFTVELEVGDSLTFQVWTINFEADFITFEISYDSYAVLGMNIVTLTKEWEEVEYKFMASETGAYKLTCTTPNTVIFYNNEWKYGDTSDNVFTIAINANETIKFIVSTADHMPGSVAFTLAKA